MTKLMPDPLNRTIVIAWVSALIGFLFLAAILNVWVAGAWVAAILGGVATGVLMLFGLLSVKRRWALVALIATALLLMIGMPALISEGLFVLVPADLGMPMLLWVFWLSVAVVAVAIARRAGGFTRKSWASTVAPALASVVGLGGLGLFFAQAGATADGIPGVIEVNPLTESGQLSHDEEFLNLVVQFDDQTPQVLTAEDGGYRLTCPVYYDVFQFALTTSDDTKPIAWNPMLWAPGGRFSSTMRALASFGFATGDCAPVHMGPVEAD
jgi:hypothetical protein